MSSARNILRDVFGVQPAYVDSAGRRHYTVFFSTYSDIVNSETRFSDFIKSEFGGEVVMRYDKTPAMSIATTSELDYATVIREFPGVNIIQSGYNYPDVSGAVSYLNSEHPPLVKYLLGLAMLTLGDQPIVWRIPGIMMGALALLLAYLIASKLLGNEVIGLLVFVFAFMDPVFRAMSSVAMLDIFATFFVTLSAWLALRKSYFLSALSIGLATSCKLTGVFPAAALFVLLVVLRKTSLKKIIFYPFVVPVLAWFGLNSPLMLKWGFQGWLNELVSGLKWFVTSRPPGAVVSSPWGWFVNEGPFPLSVDPNVSAAVNPVVYLVALAGLVLVPYWAYRRNRNSLIPVLWFTFSFLGYVAIYVLGNRTMYSFYVVTMSTMAYVIACATIYYGINFLEKGVGTRRTGAKRSRARSRSKSRKKTPRRRSR